MHARCCLCSRGEDWGRDLVDGRGSDAMCAREDLGEINVSDHLNVSSTLVLLLPNRKASAVIRCRYDVM